ncbi:hypothetical protein [Roseibacillus ishigakijimensis]|uniref:Uncharacterized protein n=1 Tax=Roseibacillus ishigakijimensis TaxID=454146 RepID=A0A934RP49_9BACT|nr:hypothetical protein [Roseibacillus ishigakijimensis]MBK1835402.1 hypothetical protein [Roseibacillus ishigakijimensis]
MKGLLTALGIMIVVIGVTSCGSGAGFSRGGGSDADAHSAFAAQKADVDFVAAWSRFQRGDRAGAGRYLDKAAATLSRQGGESSAVRHLAQRVRSGQKVSERDFETTFAGSHRAMARHYREQAEVAISDQQEQAAGASMQAMAYHTEQSANWAREPLTPQQQQEVSHLRSVGNALQAGSGYLVKGSGYVVEGTGWVLGKGFSLLTRGGERTQGTTGSILRGTGRGGETGSRWLEGAGGGLRRFGNWILGQ